MHIVNYSSESALTPCAVCAHYAHTMNSRTPQKRRAVVRKSAINLTLSADARRQARALQQALTQRSVSGVVEFLIVQAHREIFTAGKLGAVA